MDASDALSIWELDDTDWVEKARSGDASLPEALRNRRAMSAFWNPVRQRVTLFGGWSPKLSSCTLTDDEIAAQKAATEHDPTGRDALAATGCLGGYLHDTWEWDGSTLTRLTDVTYGGMLGDAPVFVQASGAQPWAAPAPAATAPQAKATPLLPWRYDRREEHFRPRTTLERAHMPADVTSEPMMGGGTPGSGVVQDGTAASPLFASQVRANVLFDEQSGRAMLQSPGDRRILSFDGAAWETAQEVRSPFDVGPNDFFAAAWDGTRQQLVLFDPTTGQTWLRDEASGWSLADDDSGPGRWSLSAAVRTEEDLPGAYAPCMPEEGDQCDPLAPGYGPTTHKVNAPKRFGQRMTEAARELPRMAYDSTRGRVVMLYRGGMWQWDGTLWTEHPAPPGWESCRAAVLLTHDAGRGKTVAVGCTVPGQTWEWDGSSWGGPFPGPYHALVERDYWWKFTNVPVSTQRQRWWEGTLQLAWAHPNAAAYSAVLGGVSTLDADGTLRTWNGQTWESGPTLPYGNECRIGGYRLYGDAYTSELGAGAPELLFPWRDSHFSKQDFVPMCFFPPLVEDAAGRELWVMRDSIKGMMSLDLDEDPQTRAWRMPRQDREWSVGMGPAWAMSLTKPYPFELMSAEHVTLVSQTDASARVWDQAVERPSWDVQVPATELTLQNLWWPYRLLRDEASGRIRVLTHRGQLWEMGTQIKKGLGETCQKDDDCGDGTCASEGVCCDLITCGQTACSTCKGTLPGKCEAVLGRVLPDPDGNLCTLEICDDMNGGHRTLAAAGTVCSDDNACNGGETCDGQGTCVAGVAPTLDDGNACTTDSCDAIEGVRHEPLAEGASCTDNNVCNGAETCDAQGTCIAGAAIPIDDGDPCTQDTCDPQTGVMHASLASGAGCVDGQGRGGTCDPGGTCFPTSDPAYEDGNPCTYDHAGGHDVLAGYSCEDGDLCNGAEVCSASGECLAGVAPVVDDGDVATLDMCDALVGVVHKVPPPIDQLLPTRIAASQAFLYQEPSPLQLGVDASKLVEKRVAVVHGKVERRDGTPLEGVRMTVHGHEEYGRTRSRPDGRFDMVVEGGGPLTVQYRKQGFLPVDRRVSTHWRRESVIDDVVMIEADAEVTTVETLSPSAQLAFGSPQVDSDGPRTAVLAFRPETGATMRLADDTFQDFDSLDVRITEYSVGDTGPRALPATLPMLSGYAYAIELTADEADAAGAVEVQFSDPVALYVDNFLNIPAGTAVPIGHYDRQAGLWKAVESGVVLDVIDTSSGSAELDLDGDGVEESAAQLEAIGIDAEERATLAGIYQAGDSLWRMEVHHFSAYAIGWAYGPSNCAVAPGGKNACNDTAYPLAHARVDRGTSLKNAVEPTAAGELLVYDSGRMLGNEGAFKLEVPITTDNVPPDVRALQVQVAIAGRVWSHSPQSCQGDCENETFSLTWNGKDAYGRPLQGEQLAVVRVGYDYDCVQKDTPAFGVGGASEITTNVDQAKDGCVATLWREDTVQIGVLNPKAQGLGGYTPASYHMYDPDTETFYSGDGSVKSFKNVPSGVQVFAGQDDPGKTDDLIPAKDSFLDYVAGLATAKDGSVYISDRGNSRILRVRPDRLVETVVSGVDATSVAVGPDGSLFFIEGRQVLRRTPDGTVAVIAGSGDECGSTNLLADGTISQHSYFDCKDGVAMAAAFQIPLGLAVAPDGSVYVSDVQTKMVRQITPSGEIWTVAGSGEVLPEGVPDDGLAAATPLLGADGIAVAPDGSLLIVEGMQYMPWNFPCYRVRRVSSGWMKTVAGHCTCYPSSFTCDSQLDLPTSIAVDGAGTIYLQELDQIRKIDAEGHVWKTDLPAGDTCGQDPDYNRLVQRAMAIDDQGSLFWVNGCHNQRVMWQPAAPTATADGEIRVPSDDGSLVHVLGLEGQIRRTVSPYLGTQFRKFYHSADRLLAAFEDQFGNRTSFNRSGPDGDVGSITGPYGHETTVGRDANGYLNLAKDPADNETSMAYGGEGLMSSSATGLGGPSCGYHSDGELRVIDQEGGYLEFTTQSEGDVFTTRVKTKMGRTASSQVMEDAGTAYERYVSADGQETSTEYRKDYTWLVDRPGVMQIEGTDQPDPQFGWDVPRPKVVKTTMPSGKSRTVYVDIEGVPFGGGSSGVGSSDLGPYAIVRTKVSVNGLNEQSESELNVEERTMKRTSPMGRGVLTTLELGQPKKVELVDVDENVLKPTVYGYDDGRIEWVTRSPERRTRFVYDAQGALESVVDYGGDTPKTLVRYTNNAVQLPREIDLQDGNLVTMRYDSHNNLASVAPPSRPEHWMLHSSLDQLTSYQPPSDGTKPWQEFEQVFGHNDDHQATSISVGGSNLLTLGYDSFGRLESLAAWPRTITLGYDTATGDLRTVSVPQQTVTYNLDGILPESDIWSGDVNASIGRVFNNKFELARETTTAAGSTHEVDYIYDADGLLKSAGGVTLVRDPKIGRVDEIHVGNLTETIKYNVYGEVASRKLLNLTGELFQVEYTPDTLGRIVRRVEKTKGITHTTDYKYHVHRGWLAEVKRDGAIVESYGYDANGNRQDNYGVVNAAVSHDEQDRLTAWQNQRFDYDALGNLTERRIVTDGVPEETTDRTNYGYDIFGNLHAVGHTKNVGQPTESTTTVTYGIDGQNRRIWKRRNGALVWKAAYRSSLQPAVWIEVADDGTETVTHFVYATGRNSPDLMIRDNQVYRLVADHVGSVRLVVNVTTGDIPQRLDYDAWGNITAEEGQARFQPFGFGGGIRDDDTGLTRFGARDYNPTIGRWTTKDPLRFGGGSTNLYLFANGDPVDYIDPGGESPAALALLFMAVSSPFLVDSSDDVAGHMAVAEIGFETLILASLGRGSAAARGGGTGFWRRLLADKGGGVAFDARVLASADDASGPVLRHYTDRAGYEAILSSQMLRANARGQVFATEAAMGAAEAEQVLFIGARTHAGRGAYVFEFRARSGVLFSPGKPGELIHRGTLRFGRQLELLFSGPNPY